MTALRSNDTGIQRAYQGGQTPATQNTCPSITRNGTPSAALFLGRQYPSRAHPEDTVAPRSDSAPALAAIEHRHLGELPVPRPWRPVDGAAASRPPHRYQAGDRRCGRVCFTPAARSVRTRGASA
ncbi:hypothetical protein GCM10009863_01080 [Streptomyces axinellae]|uniref:Uncharacterized protein n=1 Tax=Streptomyces axinellae TaxID=552788 RepID=A0ABN3PMP8_9ACTN